jgi:dihydroorotate dehydrogenase (fumarate)
MKLDTTYLGLKLDHPFIAGASPLSYQIDSLKHLQDGGVSAVVLHSLFEEQISNQQRGIDSFIKGMEDQYAESTSFFPASLDFEYLPEEYLKHITAAKEALDIPVIASINGINLGTWVEYAKWIVDAGADALELNLYSVPTSPEVSGTDLEKRMLAIIEQITHDVKIPVSVKLSPYFTSLANFASKCEDRGAKGLVLFNRFYQPDIDIDNLDIKNQLNLSRSSDLLLRLRWLSVLRGNSSNVDLAASGGVHTVEDAIKALMCGANVVQLVSVLFKRGLEQPKSLIESLKRWLEENEYESLLQMIGSMSYQNCPDPEAMERANYMKVLRTFSD